MPWRRGQSGNPGGRPKRDREIRELAREYTEDALNALVHIAKHGQSEAARVSAATSVLAFGWGRPAMQITGRDGGPIVHAHELIPQDLSTLSDRELEELASQVIGGGKASLRH